MTRRTTLSPEETIAVGREFGSLLNGGDVVAISGTLGSGKTCFVKGISEALGVHTHVGSPTFTLINEYPGARSTVVHIDLYRLKSGRELSDLGIMEYFSDDRICLIEWPELVQSLLPEDHYVVKIQHGSQQSERIITIDRTVA